MAASHSTRSSSPLKAAKSSLSSTGTSSQGKTLSLVERFRLEARQKLEEEAAKGPSKSKARALDSGDDDSDDGLPGELDLSRLMGAVGKGFRSSAAAGPSRPLPRAKASRSRSNSAASNSSSTASLEYPSLGDLSSSVASLPSSTPANRSRRSTAKTDKYSFRPKLVKPREETMLRLETKHSAAVKVGLRSAQEIAAANHGRAQRSSSPVKNASPAGAEPELGRAWDNSALVRARKRERRLGLDAQGMTELDKLIERSMRAFEETEELSEEEGEEGEDESGGQARARQQEKPGREGFAAGSRHSTPWEDSADEALSESDSESDAEAEAGDSSMATVKPEAGSPTKATKHARFDLPEEEEDEAKADTAATSSQDQALQAVEKAIMESAVPRSSPTKRRGKRSRNNDGDDDDGADQDADRLLRILKKDRKDIREAQSKGGKEPSVAWRRGRFPVHRPSPPALSSHHPIQALLLRTMAAGGEVGMYPASLSDAPRLASHLSSGLLALYDFQNGQDDDQDPQAAGQEALSLACWLFELGVHATTAALGQAAVTGLHHLLHSPCAARHVSHERLSAPLRSHMASAILGEALPQALHRLGVKPSLLDVAYGRARPSFAPTRRIHRHGLEGNTAAARLESQGRAHCVERMLTMAGLLAPHADVEVTRQASVAIAWVAADPSSHHLATPSGTALEALTGHALSQRPVTDLESFGLHLDKLDGAIQAARVVKALPSLTLRQRIVRFCAASSALLGPTAFSSDNHDTKALVPLRKLLDALDSPKPSVNPLNISHDAPGGEDQAEGARRGDTDYAALEARVELLSIALADVPLQLCKWEQEEKDPQPLAAAETDVPMSAPGDARKAPQRRLGLGGLAARQSVRQALAQLEAELKPAGDDGAAPKLRFSPSRLGMLEKLVDKLQDVNGRINERGGSKLERTRVKDKLMRLSLTIHYLVEALVGSENVGGWPSAKGGSRPSDGGGTSAKKQGRQSTLFESFASAQPRAG